MTFHPHNALTPNFRHPVGVETMEDKRLVWRPIETAPKDGTRIDVWVKRTHIQGYVDHKRICNVSWGDAEMWNGVIYQGWRGISNPYAEIVPTHWMPLPEAP